MNLFITGTDTNVGKTFFTTLFLKALRKRGLDAVGFKPIACDAEDDINAIAAASEYPDSPMDLNGVFFDRPLAPLTAAIMEGTQVDLNSIFDKFSALKSRFPHLIVEGAGGWLVPILPDYFVADLAIAMGLPVLIVVENKLGALNHTLLTVDSLQRRGVPCAGLVLNHKSHDDSPARTTNRAILETLLPIPIRAEIYPGQTELDLAGFEDLLRAG